MEPVSRRPRQNVVHGRFPNAQPAEPEDVPTPQETLASGRGGDAAEPGIPTSRRIAALIAEWGWLAYLGVAAPAIVIVALSPGRALGGTAGLVVSCTAVGAVLLGLRVFRPHAAGGWLLISGGMGLIIAGNLVSSRYQALFGVPETFPSVADALFVAAYPLVGAGMAMLIRARHPQRDRASLLDTLVLTIGVSAAAWAFMVGPIIANTFGVFYRQRARYTYRAFVLEFNKCGQSEVIGDLTLQDYIWAPDLALSTTCPPLPQSNLPQPQCFVPPCGP